MKRQIHLERRLFEDNLSSSTPDLIIHILIQCLIIRLEKNIITVKYALKYLFLIKMFKICELHIC